MSFISNIVRAIDCTLIPIHEMAGEEGKNSTKFVRAIKVQAVVTTNLKSWREILGFLRQI